MSSKINKKNTIIDNFIEYLKNNKFYFGVVFIIFIAIYGIWAFNDFVTTDAEPMYTVQGAADLYNSWIALGRWALVFMKKILGVWIINPFFALTIFIIGFPVSSMLWNHIFQKWLDMDEKNYSGRIVFDLIYLSCPIWGYQFSFRNQIEGIVLFLIILPISVFLLSKWLDGENIAYAVVAILGIVFSFSGYQAFLIMYAEAVIIYFFCNIIKGKIKRKQFYIRLLKVIVYTAAAYVLYQLSVKFVAEFLNVSREGYSNYLLTQIPWFNGDVSDCIQKTLDALKVIFFGGSNAYTVAYIIEFAIAIVLFVFYCIKKGNLKIWTGIITVLIFVFPLALSILTAGSAVLRQQFAYAMALAAVGGFEFTTLFNILADKLPRLLVQVLAIAVMICFIVPQVQTNTRLLYTNYRVAQKDYYLMSEIYTAAREKGAGLGDALVFVGGQSYGDDDSIIVQEANGISFIEWAVMYPDKTLWAMQANGFCVSMPSQEQKEYGKEIAKNIPCWPDKDSVHVEDGLIVVHLG